MQCGLYGKLLTKRDFVAIGAPRRFLDTWEPWLQSAISASHVALGRDWQAAFLAAPIWRFWLGADLCGLSVIGAFMPSLDGVGRYFPLTLFAYADDGAAISPPELDSQDPWFDCAEKLLISTLDGNRTFEAVVGDLGALAVPVQQGSKSAGADHVAAVIADGEKFADVFESLRKADHDKVYASTTCWWTIGGDGFAPVAFCAKNMPDPFLFSSMLTGKFSAAQP
jgi:type VI secretion system protein ImpM